MQHTKENDLQQSNHSYDRWTTCGILKTVVEMALKFIA